MSLPTLRQLQFLVALVELRHFGQAADRCFVTQSTLSAGIQELEAQLAVQLVERTKRRVIPTELGLAVAEKGRQMLALGDSIRQLAEADCQPLSRALKLGVIPTIGPFLLPKILPGLRSTYPQLALYLVEAQTESLLSQLHSGELDAAVLATPYDLGQFKHQVFWQECFLLAFAQGHPLGRRKGAVKSQELPLDQLLLLEEGHCLRDHALSACRLIGGEQRRSFQGTSLFTLLQMVSGGLGVTLVPEMGLDSEFLQASDIQVRALAEPGPHREWALVWRGSSQRQDEFALLASAMREQLQIATDRQR